MRLCEMTGKYYHNKIFLTKEFLDCPAACRSLGWLMNSGDFMIHKLAEKGGIFMNRVIRIEGRVVFYRQDYYVKDY